MILADRDSADFRFEGLADALATPGGAVDIRLFGKPVTRPFRRMGVALALADNADAARAVARAAADKVRIVYPD